MVPIVAAAVLILMTAGTAITLVRAFSQPPNVAGMVPGGVNPNTAGGAVNGAQGAALASERAEKAFRENDDQRAASICKDGIAEFPQDRALRVTYAKVLVAQKKPVEAYQQMEAAIANGPVEDAALQAMAGTIASAAGKADRGIEHFAVAQRLEPGNARHPLYKAMCESKLGQDTQAMASLLHVIKIDESIAEAWGTLAELNLKNDNPAPAVEQARKARTLQPGELRWRLREATALKRTMQPEKAAELLLSLAPRERAKDEVLRLVAECAGLMNQPALAAREYAAAALLFEGDLRSAEMHYQAALWYERAGDTALALQNAQVAATMGHAEAPPVLERLAKPKQ